MFSEFFTHVFLPLAGIWAALRLRIEIKQLWREIWAEGEEEAWTNVRSASRGTSW